MIISFLLIASYLLGSAPFGLILTRLAGLGDIRSIGSGNIGATNVFRTGRKDLALLTLLLDSGKGAIAVLLSGYILISLPEQKWLTNNNIPTGLNFWTEAQIAVACGAMAFLGHCFPVWLKFKGGKGVATFFGTLIAISPILALLAGGVWGLVALIFRMSSLAGLSAALSAPLLTSFVADKNYLPFLAIMTILVFYRHKENIIRIFKGTESRISAGK